MDSTIVLSRVFGPVVIATIIMILLHKDVIKWLMSFIKKSPAYHLALIGVMFITISLSLLNYHQSWSSPSDILLSLILWTMFVRGVLLLLFPETVRIFTFLLDTNRLLMGVSIGMAGAVGVYLMYVGYFG